MYGNSASPNPSYPQDIEVVRGKNRLNNTLTNTTQQGIEFIVNEDKTIKVNGTATGTSGVVLGQVELTANETYILSGCASNGGSGKYTLSISPNGETTRLVDDTGSGATYTPTTSGIYDIRLNYWYGFNIQNLIFKPMLEKGSQATSYLPYNTLEVVERGKNEFKPTLTYNDTTIRATNCSVTLNNDEFTFSATGADMRLGDIISTGSFQNMLGYLIEIPQNATNIYLLVTNNAFDKCFVGFYDSNKTSLGFQSITTSKAIPSGAKYCNFRIGKSDSVADTTYTTKIMVAFSSIDTYEPYQTPQTYQLSLGNFKPSKIGNYKDYFYRTYGKNLISGVEFGKYSETTGAKLDDNSIYRNIEPIPIKPSTTYTFSINGTSQGINKFFYDSNMNFISKASDTNATFTTPSNAYYLNIYRGTSLGNTGWQIELGSSATDYNPYGSGEWYFKAKNGYTMLKSTLGWIQAPSSVAEGTTRFYCNKSDVANLQVTQSKDILSNAFMPLTWNEIFLGDTTTKNAISDYSQANSVANRIVIRIDSNYASSVSELNTFLDNNEFYAYYLLALSTDTKITDTTMITQLEEIYNLMSYNGTTIIEIDGQLPLIIKVRALKGE